MPNPHGLCQLDVEVVLLADLELPLHHLLMALLGHCMHVTSPVPTSALTPATRSSTTATVPMLPHWPLVTCTHNTIQHNTQYNNTIQTLSYICGIITD